MHLGHKLIVLTGPESSGKSYLADMLAFNFNLPKVNEFAREFIEGLERPYVEADLKKIIAGHYAQLEQLESAENKWVIMDTDFLTVKIWGMEKYGRYPENIDLLAARFPAVHYLLCKPDIPWESDPQRENQDDRDRLFEQYKSALITFHFSHTIIKGNFQERSKLASETIESLIQRT